MQEKEKTELIEEQTGKNRDSPISFYLFFIFIYTRIVGTELLAIEKSRYNCIVGTKS